MQYDPIKKTVGRFFSGTPFMRKCFYFLLDILLLRTWHVKKALRRISLQCPDNTSVLDAGAGFGQYTWRMAGMNRNWKIKAVDIDKDHIENDAAFFKAAGLSDRISCETMDLTQLNEKSAYDLILSVDVMEHISEDGIVFRNFFNALKPGGSLLISTPSDKGGSDVHGENEKSFIDEHVRDGYGYDEITGKLEVAGFRNINVKYTYGKAGSLSWKLSMKIPVKMLNYSKLFYIILPFYYLLAFPLAIILNFIDIFSENKSGTGLLVLAIKEK